MLMCYRHMYPKVQHGSISLTLVTANLAKQNHVVGELLVPSTK